MVRERDLALIYWFSSSIQCERDPVMHIWRILMYKMVK